MKTLHTFNKAPDFDHLWSRLEKTIQPQDSLLLFENGVYHALKQPLTQSLNLQQIYVLLSDATARGIALNKDTDLRLIDYAEFVALTCEHDKVIAWY